MYFVCHTLPYPIRLWTELVNKERSVWRAQDQEFESTPIPYLSTLCLVRNINRNDPVWNLFSWGWITANGALHTLSLFFLSLNIHLRQDKANVFMRKFTVILLHIEHACEHLYFFPFFLIRAAVSNSGNNSKVGSNPIFSLSQVMNVTIFQQVTLTTHIEVSTDTEKKRSQI